MIELEDLQNCSMRSTLIFKNIPGIQNESWEDISWPLADFITCELDLPYSFEEIDFQIRGAHQALNKTRIIQTKTNKVQSRYLPSLLTGALPKSEIQFENDIFLCGAYIPPNNTTPTITTKMDYFQKLNEMLIRYKDKGNILIMRDPLTKRFTNV